MPQNIIFYFTGTGNSLKIAKDISDKLSPCKVESMVKHSGNLEEIQYERIGFVFPVYAGGLPNAVGKFIRKLGLSNNRNAYLFTVVTCGTFPVTLVETFKPLFHGKMIHVGFGNSISDVQKLLNVKGVSLSFGKRIVAYSNNILLHDMDDDVKIKTEEADKEADHIGNEIFKKVVCDKFQNRVFYKLLSRIFLKKVNDTDKSFSVSKNCNMCGLCSKICPAKNIVMQDKGPNFLHKCEQCIACIQWCPKEAINYKSITQNRKRYHHPAIKAIDMIIEKQS